MRGGRRLQLISETVTVDLVGVMSPDFVHRTSLGRRKEKRARGPSKAGLAEGYMASNLDKN
jgi:hypothetical protein